MWPLTTLPPLPSSLFVHRTRFQPGKTDAEAAAYLRQRIAACYLSLRTKGYDQIQWMQNQIPY